jgi:hypothetical protein
MKPRAHFFQYPLAILLLLAAFGPLPLLAAPQPQPAKQEIQPVTSVFAYPSNPSEGRDPFFPGSMRIYTTGNPNKLNQGPSLSDLTVKSILGTPPRVFAIINNHTFAVGDEEDVILKTGQRLLVHCTDINPKAGTVTVEANGLSQVLHLSGGP